MSKSFESGVASYIIGEATVRVHFPVDFRGNSDVSCSQCFLFRDASRRCALTGEISEYPQKYVGSSCPLEIVNNGEDAEKKEDKSHESVR